MTVGKNYHQQIHTIIFSSSQTTSTQAPFPSIDLLCSSMRPFYAVRPAPCPARAAMMRDMGKLLAYVFLLTSGLLGVWFVAGWVDGIRREGLSQTAFNLLHWPAVAITIAVPLVAMG